MISIMNPTEKLNKITPAIRIKRIIDRGKRGDDFHQQDNGNNDSHKNNQDYYNQSKSRNNPRF